MKQTCKSLEELFDTFDEHKSNSEITRGTKLVREGVSCLMLLDSLDLTVDDFKKVIGAYNDSASSRNYLDYLIPATKQTIQSACRFGYTVDDAAGLIGMATNAKAGTVSVDQLSGKVLELIESAGETKTGLSDAGRLISALSNSSNSSKSINNLVVATTGLLESLHGKPYDVSDAVSIIGALAGPINSSIRPEDLAASTSEIINESKQRSRDDIVSAITKLGVCVSSSVYLPNLTSATIEVLAFDAELSDVLPLIQTIAESNEGSLKIDGLTTAASTTVSGAKYAGVTINNASQLLTKYAELTNRGKGAVQLAQATSSSLHFVKDENLDLGNFKEMMGYVSGVVSSLQPTTLAEKTHGLIQRLEQADAELNDVNGVIDMYCRVTGYNRGDMIDLAFDTLAALKETGYDLRKAEEVAKLYMDSCEYPDEFHFNLDSGSLARATVGTLRYMHENSIDIDELKSRIDQYKNPPEEQVDEPEEEAKPSYDQIREDILYGKDASFSRLVLLGIEYLKKKKEEMTAVKIPMLSADNFEDSFKFDITHMYNEVISPGTYTGTDTEQ